MNCVNKKRGIGLVIAAAAVFAIASASSHANARNQATATNCVKVGSNGTLTYGADGSIGNFHSTQTLTLSCPIAWDSTDGFASGVVEVVDSSPSAIVCAVRAEQMGTSAASVGSGSSVGNANAYSTFFTSAATVSNGGVHLLCTIPPLESGTNEISFLVSYDIE